MGPKSKPAAKRVVPEWQDLWNSWNALTGVEEAQLKGGEALDSKLSDMEVSE